MGSLLLGCKVIIPIIVYLGIGYFFKSIKMASEKTFRELNKICFRSFLPIMIFQNIYESDIRADFTPSVLVFAIVCVLITIGASALIVNKGYKIKANRSVIVQGIYRSNFVLFGMEITRSICGEHQMGMASILVAIIVPIFNVMAVILFATYDSGRKSPKDVLLGILKNPLIISCILGIVVKLSGVTIPALPDTILTTCAKVATPLALMCLGGTFAFGNIRKYVKELSTVCLCRLIIVPLVFLSVAIALGYSGANLVALLVMLGSPAAVSSYTMASELGGNGELAGMIVVFTSVFSIITMFIWVVALSAMGLIG